MGKKMEKVPINFIQNKPKFIWPFILSIFIFPFILSFFYVNYIKNFTYKSVYNNITELSEQTATQLNLAITNQQEFLEIMIDSINSGFFKTEQEIFEHFERELKHYHFTRFVILDKYGNGVTSDGYKVDAYPNISEFFEQDEVYLSENRPSTVSDNHVNIYSKTFYFDGQKKVLFATINTEDYKEILLRQLFDGDGRTYLINSNGSILIDSLEITSENNVNLYDFLKKEYHVTKQSELKKFTQMKNNINDNTVGTFDVHFNKNVYFIHYEKVNVNNWYVVTIAPDSTIARELPLFLSISLGLCFLIVLIIIAGFLYIYISNQKQSEKLYRIAYIDSITGLGNKAYFIEKGNKYLEKQMENSYAITFDINKFKALNNIYSYEFCNQILKEIGKKIMQILPSAALMCRVSDDVFAILCTFNENIDILLNSIFNETSTLNIEGKKIHINLSIGVYKIKSKEKEINRIFDKANIARLKIKGLYHNHYYIFDEDLEKVLLEEQQIEFDMKEALKNEEFKVIYQPKIYTKDESFAGAEALVRWYKEDTIIPPNKFIPLFERNKFILKLDLYVFEQVCKDIASWKEKYTEIPIISVNVSKVHFSDENFINEYAKIADKYHIDRNKIDLEITESATVDKSIDILKILNKIKEKGFIISIDDFGTGYSSLSLLQNMPIDILKIDKVFIDKSDLKSNQNIIDYIILISKHIGVRTIVEGIETEEQVEFIRKIEGDIIQGYYYSKPIPKEELENYFER